jgi:imidazolonepropionase-like amidohydrolase
MRLLGLLFAVASCSAQALTLDCGRVLDLRSGEWREGISLVIEDGRIARLLPRAQAPADEVRVDLSGHYCLPGLIDMHVHLGSETRPEVDNLRSELSETEADAALRSVGMAERTLLAGFTTVRDLGGELALKLRNAIRAGDIRGPAIVAAGKSIATTGGHADPSNSLSRDLREALGEPMPAQGVINGPFEARAAVRARYRDGSDVIKITATGGVLSRAASGQNAQFMDDELAAIIATARDYGFKVAAHAHGAEGMKRALAAGVDSIEHGTYMDDEAIRLFRKHKAWYVPTISAGKFVAEKARLPDYYPAIVRPKATAIGPQIQGTFARAYKAGVKIAFGTDAGVFPHGDNAREFVYMVEAGMPALAALRSATLDAAELLGRSADLGQLAPGFHADVIAVAGDPLRDIALLQSVDFVMRAGQVVKAP